MRFELIYKLNGILDKCEATMFEDEENIVIPYGYTELGEECFKENRTIRSIVIPDSVTSIGNKAFYSCVNLTSIIIPNSVTSIGDGAFANCENLTVHCKRGSAAHKYCKANKIRFKAPLFG